MTKERKFKKEYAQELQRIAENDLVAARVLAKNKDVRRETVVFQIQQAVEKSLKALLCHRELLVPMVHDLALIIDRLDPVPPCSDEISDLSDFASIRRYEEGSFEITAEEIEQIMESAEKVLKYCSDEISK